MPFVHLLWFVSFLSLSLVFFALVVAPGRELRNGGDVIHHAVRSVSLPVFFGLDSMTRLARLSADNDPTKMRRDTARRQVPRSD